MDYCTIEQCHAIVNAAIAQLKLDLAQAQMDSGGSASTLSMALAGGEITGASLLASVGGAPTDAGGDAGERGRAVFDAEAGSPAVRSSGAGASSSSGLGKTPRVKALIPKQVGRTSIGTGDLDGGFVAPPRMASLSDPGGGPGSASPRDRLESRSDAGPAGAWAAGTVATPRASSTAGGVGDSVFVRGYSPEILAVGVLKKWVNYGKGWESRIVVLDAGVIRYFNTKGKNKVNVSSIMGDRECYKIGDKVDKLQRKQGSMEPREFQVRKRVFLRHFYIKCIIILPRQARDKHRETTQKRTRFCRTSPSARCISPSRRFVSPSQVSAALPPSLPAAAGYPAATAAAAAAAAALLSTVVVQNNRALVRPLGTDRAAAGD
jgi:hypothetical protein